VRAPARATRGRVLRSAALLQKREALVGHEDHVARLDLGGLAALRGRLEFDLLELDQLLPQKVAGDLVGDTTTGGRAGPLGDDLAADLVSERVEEVLLLGRGDHHRATDSEVLVEQDEGLLGDGRHETPGLGALLLRLASRGHGHAPRGGARRVVGGKGRDCAHFYLAFFCVCVCTTYFG